MDTDSRSAPPAAQEGNLFRKYDLDMTPAEARALIESLESLDEVSEVIVDNIPPEDKFKIWVGFSGVVDYLIAQVVISSVIAQFFALRGGEFRDSRGHPFYTGFDSLASDCE